MTTINAISRFPATRAMSLLLTLFFLSALSASAQVQTGTPNYGSFSGGPEAINNENLNAHFSFPVIQKPGRAGLTFTYTLGYDTSVWYPVGVSGHQTWQPSAKWGWSLDAPVTSAMISWSLVSQFQLPCNPPYDLTEETIYEYSNFSFTDMFGTPHSFGGITVYGLPSGCPYISDQGYQTYETQTAYDGSGYTMSASGNPSAGVVDARGSAVSSGSGTYTDRNGNEIIAGTNGTYTDTLGKTVLTVSGTGTPSSPYVFKYTTSTGGSASYTMKYTSYKIETNFACSGVSEYGANGTTTANMVSEIDVPDGSKYLFSYEPTPGHSSFVTGRLASVTYPAGGSVTYTYTSGNLTGSAVGSNDPIVCANGGAAGITRAVSDGTTSNSWTYARTLGTGNSSATLIAAPQMPYDSAANQTIVQFQGIYETQRDTYQGSAPSFTSVPISETTLQTSGLLQEAQTCYNGSASPCTSTAVGLPFTERSVTTILAGSQNLQSEHFDFWNSYGQPTESADYDFGSGAIGSLLKATYYSYASLGHNLNAFVQTVKVVNASGTVLYRQDKTYDSYGSGMTCVTGAPEHDDTGHGCSYTSRGNVTSTTNYTDPVTPGGAITKNFTYDSLGNMRTAQVNCCELKTANFSTTTGYAYPNSIVK